MSDDTTGNDAAGNPVYLCAACWSEVPPDNQRCSGSGRDGCGGARPASGWIEATRGREGAPGRPPYQLKVTFRSRYRLLELHSRTKVSVVLQAVDQHTGDRVAIKMPRFRSELPQFDHEYRTLVRVRGKLGSGTQLFTRFKGGDAPEYDRANDAATDFGFYAMSWEDGQTFTTFVRSAEGWSADGRTQLVARVGYHLFRALRVLHKLSLAHCDIKPDNLFVYPDCEDSVYVRVGDLGSCWDFAPPPPDPTVPGPDAPHQPRSWTHRYMSPEQHRILRGEPVTGLISGATDVFSGGVLLWYLATGEIPFAPHEDHAERLRIMGNEPPAAPSLEPELRELLHTMLRFQASERPDSRAVREWFKTYRARTQGRRDALAKLVASLREVTLELDELVAQNDLPLGPSTLEEPVRRLQGLVAQFQVVRPEPETPGTTEEPKSPPIPVPVPVPRWLANTRWAGELVLQEQTIALGLDFDERTIQVHLGMGTVQAWLEEPGRPNGDELRLHLPARGGLVAPLLFAKGVLRVPRPPSTLTGQGSVDGMPVTWRAARQ